MAVPWWPDLAASGRVHRQAADDVDRPGVELGTERGGIYRSVPLGVPREPGRAQSWKSAIEAVKPCSALRPATGPTSPAQNMPATAPPSRPWMMAASWCGVAEHLRPAAVAGEDQRSRGVMAGEEQLEVLARGGGVADLELQGRAHRHLVADGDRTRLRVGPEKAPDQEVTSLEVELAIIDHDPAAQALASQLSVGGLQRLHRLPQPLEGGSTRELVR